MPLIRKRLRQSLPPFQILKLRKKQTLTGFPEKPVLNSMTISFAKKTIGRDVSLVDMGNALLDGYNYGLKALDCDTVVDAKGKVKTKLKKDIVSRITGHANDFLNAGAAFWESREFGKAYEAFTDYLAIPANPRFGKNAPPHFPTLQLRQSNITALLPHGRQKCFRRQPSHLTSFLLWAMTNPQL